MTLFANINAEINKFVKLELPKIERSLDYNFKHVLRMTSEWIQQMSDPRSAECVHQPSDVISITHVCPPISLTIQTDRGSDLVNGQ